MATAGSAARPGKAAARPAGGGRRKANPAGSGRGAGVPASGRARAEARRRTAKRPGRAASGKGKTVSRHRSAGGSVAGTELSYYVLIPTAALLLLGLVMVFSAGSAIGIDQSAGGYHYFIQQLEWAGL
ncbi:MAG: hypothetical protein KKE56_04635, partial [Actinobacteria bacterium]|nr:hypothetical protein [Actinomycetota bacterium]